MSKRGFEQMYVKLVVGMTQYEQSVITAFNLLCCMYIKSVLKLGLTHGETSGAERPQGWGNLTTSMYVVYVSRQSALQ